MRDFLATVLFGLTFLVGVQFVSSVKGTKEKGVDGKQRVGHPGLEVDASKFHVLLSTGETGVVLTSMNSWEGETIFFVALDPVVLAAVIRGDPVLGDTGFNVLMAQNIPEGSWLLAGIAKESGASANAWLQPQSRQGPADMGILSRSGPPRDWEQIFSFLFHVTTNEAKVVAPERVDDLLRSRGIEYGRVPANPSSGAWRLGLQLHEGHRGV